jgi:hypothetical protein
MVVLHEGVVTDTGLQAYLNAQAQAGWRFAGSIFAPAQTGEAARLLIVLERV